MFDNAALDANLELFFGAADMAHCRVYARLSALSLPAGCTLGGKLLGPFCQHAQTLPATFQFLDRGPGATLLAESLISEPNFWTPEAPHWYRATVELTHAGQVLATFEREFGIRPLAPAGNRLRLAGKNWVLRAISAGDLPLPTGNAASSVGVQGATAGLSSSASLDLTSLLPWHESETAMFVRQPSDALCQAASHAGVLLVADVPTGNLAEVRHLCRWPAVGCIVLPSTVSNDVQTLAHNTILAQRYSSEQPVAPAAWAQAVICDVSPGGTLPDSILRGTLPCFAFRAGGPYDSVATGRADCDRLQRDLAPSGQQAGYIV